ncbi:MAG: PGF-pre-PGF domain-containing protein, partial [Candidatus Hadarchaeales archaeon]
MRKKIATTFALLFLFLISCSPASALHAPQIIVDPGRRAEVERETYTLIVKNLSGNPITEVKVNIPSGFENIKEAITPDGWTCSISGSTITYSTSENAIASGQTAEFEFEAMTPALEEAVEMQYLWTISTADIAGFTENMVKDIVIDNLSPSLSISIIPSPASAIEVELKIVASERLGSLDNVYLTIENSEIENTEQRKYWANLIKILGPLSMSTTDLKVWKSTFTVTEKLEDNSPAILVLNEKTCDFVGNRMENPLVHPIAVDTRRPTLPAAPDLCIFPAETNVPLTIYGIAKDNVGGLPTPVQGLTIRVKVGGEAWITTSGPDGSFSITVQLHDGANMIGVRVLDAAGNFSLENLQVVFFDNVPPTISNFRLRKNGVLLGTENGVTITETWPEILVDIFDGWNVRKAGMSLLRGDGSPVEIDVVYENGVLRGMPKSELSPGPYFVTVTAKDGWTIDLNSATACWFFSVANPHPPPVSIPQPPSFTEAIIKNKQPPLVVEMVPTSKITFLLNLITAGEEFSLSLSPYEMKVRTVTMMISENRENFAISVKLLENLSAGTPFIEDFLPYEFFEIRTDDDSLVQGIKISFEVSKEWINNNDMYENNLLLYLLENGEWKKGEMVREGENSSHLFFSAQLPRPLLFGIGGCKTTQRAPPPPEAPAAAILVPATIFVAILVGGGALLYWR